MSEKGVLTRPWVLMELHTALTSGVPIVTSCIPLAELPTVFVEHELPRLYAWLVNVSRHIPGFDHKNPAFAADESTTIAGIKFYEHSGCGPEIQALFTMNTAIMGG